MPKASAAQAMKEWSAASDGAAELVSRHKILFVGESEIQAKKFEFYLGKFGYDVVWSKTSGEAWKQLQSDGVSLVISEVLSGDGGKGLELLERARGDSRYDRLPFVLLTEPSDYERLVDPRTVQANDVLIKPFRPQELQIRLKNLIALSEYERLLTDENRLLTNEVFEKKRELEENYKTLAKAHEELQALQSQLVQSAKFASLGVLSMGLAHEINNPLAIIVGYNSMLSNKMKKGEVQPESALKFHDLIEANAIRISKIIATLRRLSTYEALDEFHEPVEMDDVIESLREQIEKKSLENSVTLRLDPRAGHARLRIDANLLKQTLLAIIENSMHAMKASKERELAIRTRLNGDRIEIAINDTGTGIKPEIRDKVFDPFFTTKGPDSGGGLGLTVAYRTITDFGGEISFVCPDEGGTRFLISFPRFEDPT